MRILLVHNYYGSDAPSGETNVFNVEKSLLESEGNIVDVFNRDSDEIRNQGVIGLVKGALSTPWNPFSAAALRDKVIDFKPDVVHVHNTFPLISPAIFHAIGNLAAKVLTLHNYRLLCPAAIPMRNGHVCTDCIDQKSVIPSIKYSCYRDSRIATLPLAANVALHRYKKTWHHNVDAFIALSDFQKEIMSKGGLPEEKMHVKPNFYSEWPTVYPYKQRDNYIIFVGRLSSEKGVRTLVKAWRYLGTEAPLLKIVGSGPLEEELKANCQDLNIEFLGHTPANKTQQLIGMASLLILPSEWFETFGLVVIEAFAHGTPVAASNIGALPSIIDDNVNGVIFEPANITDLAEKVSKLLSDKNSLEKMSLEARVSFEHKYSKTSNYRILHDIYTKSISNHKARL